MAIERLVRSIAVLALVALICVSRCGGVEAAPAGGNITIGVLLTSGVFKQYGTETRPIVEYFRAAVNSFERGVGDTGLGIDIMYMPCGDSVASATAAATQMLNAGRVQFVLAPYSSDLTAAAALVFNPAKIIVFAPNGAAENVYICDEKLLSPCSVPFVRRFAYLLSVITPARFYMEPFVSLMKIQQISSLGVLSENTTFGLALRAGTATAAGNNRIPVTIDIVIPQLLHTNVTRDSDDTRLLAALRQLETAKPDAVVLGTNTVETCYRMVELMEQYNINFGAVAVGTCVSNAMTVRLGSKARYFFGPQQWAKELTGNTYTETPNNLLHLFNAAPDGSAPSPVQYNAMELATYGQPATYQGASVMAALYQMYIAIAIANSTDSDAVLKAALVSYESSFFGTITTDRFGQNTQKPMVTLQYNSDESPSTFIVTPLGAAQFNPIYPMPKWTDRVFVSKVYSTTPEKVVSALIGAAIAFSLFLIINLWRYRETRILKAVSIEFCTGSIVGCIMVYCSLFGFPIEASDSLCASQPWLLPLGIALVMSPLAARQYRIDRIFNNKDFASKAALTNIRLWFETVAFIAPQLVISLIWSIAAIPTARVVTVDPLRPAMNYTECAYSTVSLVFAVLTFIVLAAQILFVCWLAIRIRNVVDDFNESKTLAGSAYVFLFSWTIIITLQLIQVGDRTSQYWLRAILVLVGMITFQIVLFVPKLLIVVNGKGDKSYVGSGANANNVVRSGLEAAPRTTGGNNSHSVNVNPSHVGGAGSGGEHKSSAAKEAGLRTRVYTEKEEMNRLLGGRTPESVELYRLLPAAQASVLTQNWGTLYGNIGRLLGGSSTPTNSPNGGGSLIDADGASNSRAPSRQATAEYVPSGPEPRLGGTTVTPAGVTVQLVTFPDPEPPTGGAGPTQPPRTAPLSPVRPGYRLSTGSTSSNNATGLSADIPVLEDGSSAASRMAAVSFAPPPPPPNA